MQASQRTSSDDHDSGAAVKPLFRPRELAWLITLGAALALLPITYLVWHTAAGAGRRHRLDLPFER
jgi:hypothetical protein